MIPLVMIIGAVAIVGFELWRRALRGRVPRWLTAILIAAYVAIAGGASFTWWKLHATFNEIGDESGRQTSMLAYGIARAMTGTLVALVAAIVATALLVWASLRRAR